MGICNAAMSTTDPVSQANGTSIIPGVGTKSTITAGSTRQSLPGTCLPGAADSCSNSSSGGGGGGKQGATDCFDSHGGQHALPFAMKAPPELTASRVYDEIKWIDLNMQHNERIGEWATHMHPLRLVFVSSRVFNGCFQWVARVRRPRGVR